MALVHLQIGDGIATITLDSPANRNALSKQLTGELMSALERVAADQEVRAVLITHTGNVFCSGADLAEARGEGMDAGTRRMIGLFRGVVESPKPVVAKIGGKVRAGGLGLMAACDVVVAAETVDFAFTEARLGLTPATISLAVLPRMDARAAGRYFLTGETFGAAEAARIGLVSSAVPPADLDAAVAEVLDGLRRSSPQGLAESKLLVTEPVRQALTERGDEMAALSARLFASEEAKEGMTAFLERRPPRWQAG